MELIAKASYYVLDAAKAGSAFELAAKRQPEYASLYRGDSAYQLAAVAPYLFKIDKDGGFVRWLLENAKGNSWGVFLQSSASIEDVRLHLRKHLMVKDEMERELYFRYYDPRVLHLILPTFKPSELSAFFGPVEAFFAENSDATSLVSYRLVEGILQTSSEKYPNQI